MLLIIGVICLTISKRDQRLIKEGRMDPSALDVNELPHFKWVAKQAGGRRWVSYALFFVLPPVLLCGFFVLF